MLQRQKSKIYLCKRDLTQKKVKVYEEPVALWIDVQPATSMYLMETIGNIDKNYMVAKVNASTASNFSKGDKCYITKTPPTEFDELCLDADYEVISVKLINSTAEITFEGLI